MNRYQTLLHEAVQEGITRFAVGGIIVRSRKVLLLERPQEDFMGGLYELPSGKVEVGESLDAALIREVKEETGFEVADIGTHVGHFDYLSKGGIVTRQFNFQVEVTDGALTLTEHVGFAWVELEALGVYSISDQVVALLRATL